MPDANYRKFNTLASESGAIVRKFNTIAVPSTSQKTILSNAKIKIVDIQKTILSDAFITTTTQRTILSNAKIKSINNQKTLLSDTKIIIPAEYGTAIGYYNNKLYISCETSPAKFVVVNVTGGNLVAWDTYELNAGIENYINAHNLTINTTFNKLFLSCDDGKIAKINLSDVSIREEIDVVDIDDLITITDYDAFDKLYAGTNNSNYEFYLIDNAIISTIDTSFIFLKRTIQTIKNVLSFVFKKIINTDFRFLLLQKDIVSTDLRFNLTDYESISDSLISANDFIITINGTSITDFIQTSIKITLNADEKSQVEFTLTRKHDRLNYTLDNVYNQITDNNPVTIAIGSTLIFNGKINSLNCSSSDESVVVHANGDEYEQSTAAISLSLPSLNEQLHPYHVLVNNVIINNPYIEETEENPEFYKGVKVLLGTEEQEVLYKLDSYVSMTPEEFEVFIPDQNYTYFWYVSGHNFITNWGFTNKYIGTSLASLYSDTFEIESIRYKKQRQFNNAIFDLGYYTLGSAPYKEISTKNGAYFAHLRWEDRPDGLYDIYSEQYNFIKYAKDVATTEYQKIQNINGNILPRTSADITLTIDAFLYYNIKLLNRVNIVNTTESEIYENFNGFPLSIKSMIIDTGTMKVDLRLDNEWSNSELDAIDATLPIEPEIIDEFSLKIEEKYDLSKQDYID